MKKVFIVGAKRTAIGTFGGTLKDVPAVEIGVTASKAAIEHSKVDPKNIEEAIMGCILTANQGMGPGRQVSIGAGLPIESPGYSVNMLCGSGMKSTMIGAQDILLGEAELVLTGGMENMSIAPYMLDKARFGYRMGSGSIVDHMIRDGLTDVFNDYHMGVTAENLAEKYGISRLEQDEFALESQKRAKEAISAGKFKDEIVPLVIKGRKGDVVFDTDEHPRDTSMEILGKLRPAFKKDGSVTAGNSSGINDGASATVLASEEAVEKYGLKPIAEIVSFAQAGVDPAIMGYGPVPAVEKALKKASMDVKAIDLIELNEAFASQSLSVLKGLMEIYGVSKEWLLDRTNVNGGAIALGHPIGASGNRIIVTLLYEMEKRNLEFGLASLCIGGGMGTAVVVKRV
ncbi:MAG: acetyl-CoA C-acetyltransferase [Mesotoga sp.]|uniref:acetyl-CoA C-acetyltransferase n=1 Tax=unclassified Mesotoga TaxID=1184398 RepID=UPI000EF1B2E2|nr:MULTISPECIES: acetyl-CoA C-acetyltransferase [unclassified Mesotoga]NLT46267.1 acetyl-CoA C-acetyltransferase [Thermotogaceae bacterium]MDD2332821.1 acetyl-CoA C-acetyltransferase [Mesotoga sp.]MDD3680072.1 acetyl-CoA C-acetyltransferase [Mesotoga sp.]MDD4206674.1 acetyl-CoA C-acetyltransferase [Mesotoga sp.]MDD4825416.1 acetyl-CoA C-acetyltransferase [Mesotoga sp.]